MRGLVSFILLGVAVLFRGQQLAPYFSIGPSVGGQVNRKATRISKTLQRTVKGVLHCERSNHRNTQIMIIVFCENILAKFRVKLYEKKKQESIKLLANARLANWLPLHLAQERFVQLKPQKHNHVINGTASCQSMFFH